MRTFILVLLTVFLTGCYTSIHTTQDRPTRTVITTPTHLTYYYYPTYYNQIWVHNRYVYVPRYYVYNTTYVNTPVVRTTTRTVRQQPRSTGISNRSVRTQRPPVRHTPTRTVQPRNSSTVQRQSNTTRTRGSVNRSSNTRNERGSNNRNRNRSNN